LYNNVNDSENPRLYGKGLSANCAGEWRYRIGNYRVLAEIREDCVQVQVFKVGHRRDIY
ncbi:MAG: type II toxin-antitoxin system RelE/ParE family toxin, partial [Streptococcaceae bacterium]|nr:type II toxin-antitoxin system RelE/ParE family toxin [Streptococcaceae bacterium]